MPVARPSRTRRRSAFALLALATAATIVAVPLGATAAPAGPPDVFARADATARPPLVDVRAHASANHTSLSAAQSALASDLGDEGLLDVDEVTGAPRVIARLDGFLTGPSGAAPEDIALAYLHEHRDAFGVSDTDLGGMRLVRDYIDILGTHHLTWVQTVDGVPLWDSDVRAHVPADGELVAITGAPVADVDVANPSPTLSAKGAVAASYADAGGPQAVGVVSRSSSGPQLATTFSSGDDARLVLLDLGRETRLAWRTTTFVDEDQIDVSLVDAETADVLWRTNLVRSDGTGLAWPDRPGTTVPNGGGTPVTVTFPVNDGSALRGPNAWVFPDVDDDNHPDEQIGASSGLDWSFPGVFDTSDDTNACSPRYPCSWQAGQGFSWEANVEQNATQVYAFLNRFHDHLLAEPIGFTPAAGNFEGNDAVVANVFDGADTSSHNGLPDSDHRTNANMATLPDGRAPLMQMYLFPSDPAHGIPSTNGGDDASVVFHEYTHGLSSRLVTYADGTAALNSAQAGAMGEAWSDFYAMDYLVSSGYETDGAGADVSLARYVSGGRTDYLRSEPIDCGVGQASGQCPGGSRTGAGGYTYGDFGDVYGFVEVHGDSEIWGQTLWDLREALGSETALMLVTRAMELSPVEPSFLDMRNAIVEADRIAFDGANTDAIWQVFADRGMGFFAIAVDGSDTTPAEDFSVPPTCPADCGTVRGRLVDSETGEPVHGVRVGLAGHASGFLGDLAATTTRNGGFTIADVPDHRYELVIDAPGYETLSKTVTVNGDERVRLQARRDWAALDGGARLVSATKPDYSAYGCGPDRAFDGSAATGWGSDAPGNDDSGKTGPRSAVVRLASTVTVTSFGFATDGTCGDSGASAVKAFTILTRTVGGRWIEAYDNASLLERGVIHTLRPDAGTERVRFVKIVMRSSANDPQFMDMLELSVRGTTRGR
jgi:extracellular elastinolytic metalloproteinase